MLLLSLLLASLAPVRIQHAPTIDGHLDEWTTIPSSDSFRQTFPIDGDPASEPTRIRVAYDTDNLYVAIECVQRTPSLARLTRRDRDVADDRVSVDIDTGHDRRTAFHFQISAAGVLGDGMRYDDTELSTDWDEIWQGEVAQTANGWTAELRIPLRVLRLRSRVHTWGFQVRRWIGATGEISQWAYAPRDSGGEVSRYGDLGPFEGLAPRGTIAVVPFALSRFVRSDASVPSTFGDGVSVAAGLDVLWRPTRGVAIVGAVLPDFAQVEADQVILNLTTTEIALPEKRPFFLQGLDLFATPMQLLYTRRIGQPAESPALPTGATQLAPTGAAPILGAAKLVGSAGGFEVGVLSALTGGVEAKTDLGDVQAVPVTSHHVARVRMTRDRLAVGALATARVAHEDPTRYPAIIDSAQCPTGDVVAIGERCAHDAYVGSVDAAWRSEGGDWVAGGQLAATRIEGGPPRTRPDGTVVESGDVGTGGIVKVARQGGTLRGAAAYERFSRDFDIDDLGFLPRANLEHGWVDLEAYTAQSHGPLIESRAKLELFWRRNLDGLALPSGYQWNVSGTTKGMWHGFLEMHWRPAIFDDREFGDGRALQRAGRLGVEIEGRTDTRRSVVGAMSAYLVSTRGGGQLSVEGQVDMRPRDNVEISLLPQLLLVRGEPRFLEDDAAGPRFARQDATSAGLTARATWTLTRDITLQGYVQALLATIRYRDAFTADPADRVVELAALRPAMFDPATYDAREGALNATVVGRWEYRPGSTAFVVYTHAQTPRPGATYAPGALIGGPASDVVMLKLSWAWLR